MSRGQKAARPGPRRSGRALARYRVVQALYAWRQGGEAPWDGAAMPGSDDEPLGDAGYRQFLLQSLEANLSALQQHLAQALDRPADSLDPVEYSIIILGLCELAYSKDVPAAVIIDEAVEIAKLLAGTDSYKYVNALLNSAAGQLRQQQGMR